MFKGLVKLFNKNQGNMKLNEQNWFILHQRRFKWLNIAYSNVIFKKVKSYLRNWLKLSASFLKEEYKINKRNYVIYCNSTPVMMYIKYQMKFILEFLG